MATAGTLSLLHWETPQSFNYVYVRKFQSFWLAENRSSLGRLALLVPCICSTTVRWLLVTWPLDSHLVTFTLHWFAHILNTSAHLSKTHGIKQLRLTLDIGLPGPTLCHGSQKESPVLPPCLPLKTYIGTFTSFAPHQVINWSKLFSSWCADCSDLADLRQVGWDLGSSTWWLVNVLADRQVPWFHVCGPVLEMLPMIKPRLCRPIISYVLLNTAPCSCA